MEGGRIGSSGKSAISINLVVTSGGAGFPGHSRVLRAISYDSSELNVISTAGDVDCDYWGYENSKGGMDEEVLDDCQTGACQTSEFHRPWHVIRYISQYPHSCSLMMIGQSTSLILRRVSL